MKNWSKFQKAIFTWVKENIGSLIVEAVAGSGKTTTLVEAVKHMIGDIAVMAYNKKMGDELKDRLKGLPNAIAGTCHSFGLRQLFKAGIRAQIDNDGKVKNILTQLLTEDEKFMYGFIKKLVSFAKNDGIGIICPIDDKNVWQDIVEHHDMSLDNDSDEVFSQEAYDRAIQLAIRTLQISNNDRKVIDCDDMIYLPLLFNVRFDKYDWVLLDEAQDTNNTRRLLAKAMLKETGRFIAVGDPRQAIFGFTGADNDSLDLIQTAFQAVTLPLSVCYRCAKSIIAHAKQWNPTIEAFEGNPEGIVRSMEYADLLTSAKGLNLTGKDGILCRKNAPLVALAFNLIRQGIGCRVEGRDIGQGFINLVHKWKVQNLNKLSERLVAYRDREVKKFLAKEQEDKADQVKDRVETLMVLIARCNEQNKHSVSDLVSLINSMFSDANSKFTNPNIVTLSSVHKSKGLEWDRVFLLGREQFMPSKWAKKAWQKEQENNLIYVAVTRAMSELVEVNGLPE